MDGMLGQVNMQHLRPQLQEPQPYTSFSFGLTKSREK